MRTRLLYGGVGVFFLLFFLAPVASVYVEAFRGMTPGGVVEAVAGVLGSSRTAGIVGFTAGQAALSAAIGVVVALPVAYVVSHYEFPGKRLVYSLSLIPFVLPSIIVVVCMISFYGKSGLVNSLLGTDHNLVYNFRGIVLAHIFYDFSLAIRVIATAWRSIDRRYREAAQSLGETRPGVFARVTIPLLAPAIISGFALIFIYTFLSFGIILVFGGVRFATLEVAIYQEMFIDLDLASAAVYSLVQLLLSGLFIVASSRAIARGNVARVAQEADLPALSSAKPVPRIAMAGCLVLVIVFVLGPIVTMIARAFLDAGGTASLENFRELLVPGAADRNIESILRSTVAGVIGRSIGIAAASGTLTFVVAAAIAFSLRGKKSVLADSLLQLPIGMSLVTVGIGLRFVWDGIVPPGLLVVAGQFFVAFPLVYRIVRTGLEEQGSGPVLAARVLGAGRWRILWDIELPLQKRTLLNGYAYALALPFADLTVVLSAGEGRIATFPVAIYRLIGFRSFDLALALAVIYIAICLGLFLVIDATSFRVKETTHGTT